MANKRVGGIILLKLDSNLLKAKGAFTYNLGKPKREAIVGQDFVHGFKEEPQVPFIEGTITDDDELDVETLLLTRDATATIELANGKIIALNEAFYAGEGDITTDEGEIAFRLEGITADEIR